MWDVSIQLNVGVHGLIFLQRRETRISVLEWRPPIPKSIKIRCSMFCSYSTLSANIVESGSFFVFTCFNPMNAIR